MLQVSRLLVPIDFSEFSNQALRYGIELTQRFNAELHLLHVLEVHSSGAPVFTMGLALPERQEESNEVALKRLEALPGSDIPESSRVVRATAHGSPLVQIIRYASDQEIDMIIMGTHGRTGLTHVLLGSVAENVVRQAPCPVLIVRNEGHQFVAF